MCFSSTASFVAGGALTAAGIATLAHTKDKREWPLASVPLLFGVQQIVEGFVWLSLEWSATAQCLTTNTYLFFANILWPVLIPIAVLLVERDRERRKFMRIFGVVGVAVAAYMLYAMVFPGITARATPDHIAYVPARNFPLWVMAGYVLATCGVEFFSRDKWIKFLGAAVSMSLLAAYIFYRAALPSVWCFFSAILSVIVYGYFLKKHPDRSVVRIFSWK